MTAGIVVNLIALAALLALVSWWARRPTETVRLRNALRLQPGRDEDFTWVPPHFPPGFAVEHRQPGTEFRDVVASLGIEAIPGDWGKALAIAGHLTECAEDKGAVRADPIATYRAIRTGYGYCADFVKVFLVLAQAAGLIARQWAFSFDGFGGHGHTVVEVFDRERGRWLLLDVFNNFHVVDAEDGEPMGALEYREALRGRRGTASMRRNGPGRLGFIHEHKAVEYYLRGIDHWYLMWGNAVLSNYANPVVRAMGRISPTLMAIAANVLGGQPHIRLYATPDNTGEVRKMFALRRWLCWTMFAIAGLTVLLGAQLLSAFLGRTTG